MPPNQVQQYCMHLANAFIIHEVNRYDIVGRRIFEIGNKYYFENTGIRNVIIGYQLKDRGKLLENIVLNQLLYKGYDVKIGSFHAQEIDFVCERANERLYVQVALRLDKQETIEREFGNLLAIPDNYPKIVVSEDRAGLLVNCWCRPRRIMPGLPERRSPGWDNSFCKVYLTLPAN